MAPKDLRLRPKHIELIARAIVVSGDCVLLCESLKGGYAYLPGGHVEVGETAQQALARELMEEAGVVIRPTSLLQCHESIFHQSGNPRHEVNLVFHVEHDLDAGREVVSCEKNIRFVWHRMADLASIDVRPSAAVAMLQELSHGRLPPMHACDRI